MARRNDAALGCLGIAVLPLALLSWCADTCTGRAEKERAAREAEQQVARLAAIQADASEKQRREAKEARERAAKETARREAKDTLVKGGPSARARAVQACARSLSTCPGGSYGPELIYEAAKTTGEGKQLKATFTANERQQARANASLRCCDGTDSPSCTCGNPRRGCCSHHGGVCGCSAD